MFLVQNSVVQLITVLEEITMHYNWILNGIAAPILYIQMICVAPGYRGPD